MAATQSILSAYEQALKKLAEELIAENNPSEDEKAHLLLIMSLVQALVKAYDTHQVNQMLALEASRSASYSPGEPGRRVLNVTLRSLVDNDLMTPWYARFINSNLGMKRSVFITGGPNVGKSTLLNALIDLLPRDHRIVYVDDAEEGLPTLRERSFTVHLKAKRGTPARAGVFKRAADMKPVWIVVGEVARRDGPSLFEVLTTGPSALATIQSTDPEVTFADWVATSKTTAEQIKQLNPLVVHLVRDEGGRPRLERVIEISVEKGSLVVTPRQPVEGEPVGIPGGTRSSDRR